MSLGGGSVGRSVGGTAVSGGRVVAGKVRVGVAVRVGRGVAVRTGMMTGRRGTHSLCPVRIRLEGRQFALRSVTQLTPVCRPIL